MSTEKQLIKQAENILTKHYDYISKFNAVKYLSKEHGIRLHISVKAYDNLVANEIY